MPRFTTRFIAFATFFIMTAIAGATPAGKEGRKESAAEGLRKALDFGVTLELSDTPLPNVVQQIADMAKVNIVVDRTAMMATGDPSDMAVTLKAKEMKLRTALRTVCSQHGLTFAIVGDHILISTEDVVNYRQLRQRVSVDLDGIALPKALKDLSAQTATNLLLDPRSIKTAGDAKITLQLDDVPLDTAVRLMAEMAGLKPVRLGNVLFVTTEERAERLKVDADLTPPASIIGRDLPGGGAVAPGVPMVVPPPALPPAAPAAPAMPPAAPAKPAETPKTDK